MTGRMGVAVSTTGDDHRLGFLETSVRHWQAALPPDAPLFVTVDGTDEKAQVVANLLRDTEASVYRVGQREDGASREGRLGVATNKNTGIELLMGCMNPVQHLFLSDDDTYPRFPQSLTKHIDLFKSGFPHSVVCWGKSRLDKVDGHCALWTWPRGVLLYASRAVVAEVGGMDERFGPGGHEHVEWSQRIHNAGLTPDPFITPASYATRGGQGAAALWHCEDMPRPGEPHGTLGSRRRQITSVRKQPGDWTQIGKVMVEREGSTEYVSYSAEDNGRVSATLYSTNL